MLIQYEELNLSKKTLAVIDTANAIINEYQAEGLKLTLRQLYYQFVARGIIENSDKSYDRLGEAINKGRLAGLISWQAIEDRTRYVRRNSHWSSPKEIIESARNGYAIDMWDNQAHRVEVWVEKDAALNGVERVCEELDVPYASCRGYTSQSAQWAAARRMEQYEQWGQKPILIYLGDHDPSGIDMGRDHDKRLVQVFGTDVEVRRIALNMDQIEQYNPPPNPAKISDSRCDGYVAKFGKSSWELDALSPRIIEGLVRDAIDEFRDPEQWDRMEQRLTDERATLDRLLEGL